MAFLTPIDIAKRACQHVGNFPIVSFQDNSRQAIEINNSYDSLRLAELSRHTWAFSVRRARCRPIGSTTQIWTPPAWAVGTTYTIGQVATFASSTYANSASYSWILTAASDVGDSPDVSPLWSHYFGPLTVDVFDSGATYAAGEIALVPPTYAGGTTYSKNNIVADSNGNFWVSLVNANTGNTPSSSPTFWTAWVLPSSGSASTTPTITFQSAPSVFLCIVNETTPPSPVVLPGASANWTNVGGTVSQLTILFPLNAGPLDAGINNQSTAVNLYRLPFGWLRPSSVPFSTGRAKHPWLGALYGYTPTDIVYQGQYFTSWSTGPVDLDFIADIADVTLMPPQFCESLAIRIAKEIDAPLTSSKNTAKLNQAYRDITGEAMRIDMIVQGDPAEDLEELIQVRF